MKKRITCIFLVSIMLLSSFAISFAELEDNKISSHEIDKETLEIIFQRVRENLEEVTGEDITGLEKRTKNIMSSEYATGSELEELYDTISNVFERIDNNVIEETYKRTLKELDKEMKVSVNEDTVNMAILAKKSNEGYTLQADSDHLVAIGIINPSNPLAVRGGTWGSEVTVKLINNNVLPVVVDVSCSIGGESFSEQLAPAFMSAAERDLHFLRAPYQSYNYLISITSYADALSVSYFIYDTYI